MERPLLYSHFLFLQLGEKMFAAQQLPTRYMQVFVTVHGTFEYTIDGIRESTPFFLMAPLFKNKRHATCGVGWKNSSTAAPSFR